jgi:chaperone BCS1
LKGNYNNVEVLPCKWFKTSSFVDYDETQKINEEFFMLGVGEHEIVLESSTFQLSVRNYIDSKELVVSGDYSPEIIKQVIVDVVVCNDPRESIDVLFKNAREAWHQLCEKLKCLRNDVIKKYVYDPEGFWDFMSTTEHRPKESLFLKQGEQEKILEYVEKFVKHETKQEYIKFNVPYKSNILLYGVAGAGKTSTCLVVASYLKTNIGIIPIAKDLDDSKLIHAINNVKKNDCKVIIIEDIDCLFHDRKAHDTLHNSLTLSGILNCLDGLCRNEGIIVFLTTNNVSALDSAMIRSSRIDYRLAYDYADEFQTKKCFEYFCPHLMHEFEVFYQGISHKKYTIANLQEFLFKNKDRETLTKSIKEFLSIVEANHQLTDVNSGEQNSLYM